MTGVYILLCGLGLFALAALIAIDTSMGGTRSDYNDGSGILVGLGALLVVAGIITLIVEGFLT